MLSRLVVSVSVGSLFVASAAAADVPLYVTTDLYKFYAPRVGLSLHSFSGASQRHIHENDSASEVDDRLGKDQGRNAILYSISNLQSLQGGSLLVGDKDNLANPASTEIEYNGPALGLFIQTTQNAPLSYTLYRDYDGISYDVAYASGVIASPNTTGFLGFDTGSGSEDLYVHVVLSSISSFYVDGIYSAVPEAATWAMMMVGLGVVGGSLRRRRNVTTRVAFA